MGLPEERALGVVGADRGRRRFVDLDQRTARGRQIAQERVEGGRAVERRVAARAGGGSIAALPCTGPATACLRARSVRRWVADQARARSRSAGGPPSVTGSRPADSWARTAASTSASRGASTGSGGRGRAPSSVVNIEARSVTAAWRPHRPGGGGRLIRCPPARALATGSGSAGRGTCGMWLRDPGLDG